MITRVYNYCEQLHFDLSLPASNEKALHRNIVIELQMSERGSYRKILLPKVVEDFAVSSPFGVYARVLGPRWREEGPTDITYLQLSKAVDKVSFWLDETLGPAEKGKVFAYHGANDLRYAFLLVAAVKTRRRVGFHNGYLIEQNCADTFSSL
jgi:hypothetical protein